MDKISTGISCISFSQRLLRCSYFKEKDDYLKGARLLFERILKKYDGSKSIVELFAEEFSNRAYTGVRRIYTTDREMFREFCVACAINLDLLFSSHSVTNIMDNFNWKWKIKGTVGCILNMKNKFNVYFVFKNISSTKKEVDIYSLINYIYNEASGNNNDALVMSVYTNSFFLVPYDKTDYTIQRGFATFTKRNKLRKRGDHCGQCKESCKPEFFSNLDRLESIYD